MVSYDINLGLFQLILLRYVLDYLRITLVHTQGREKAQMPSYFDFYYHFDCRRGFRNLNTTNFRINIQSAKACMTSDVMQQFLIDVLMFSPYFITSNASLRS